MHQDCVIHTHEQGSDEWHQARNGLLTASEMKLALTDTLKIANNEKTRTHIWELSAQRINSYTEMSYVGEAMLRGHVDEVKARDLYSENYEPVEEMGFITRDIGGVVLGYSPDGAGVMGNFGIECKSRIQKYQVETIVTNEVPKEHILQIQTGLLVTGWDYISYISYSGGMPMWRIDCEPIDEYQDAIAEASLAFEAQINEKMEKYYDRLKASERIIETEREVIDLDMVI